MTNLTRGKPAQGLRGILKHKSLSPGSETSEATVGPVTTRTRGRKRANAMSHSPPSKPPKRVTFQLTDNDRPIVKEEPAAETQSIKSEDSPKREVVYTFVEDMEVDAGDKDMDGDLLDNVKPPDSSSNFSPAQTFKQKNQVKPMSEADEKLLAENLIRSRVRFKRRKLMESVGTVAFHQRLGGGWWDEGDSENDAPYESSSDEE